MDDVSSVATCKFCSEPCKYTCPRCNQRYCSTECYKSSLHAQCSELFYRECFMEGLRTMDADPEDRHRVVEMLQRLESESPEHLDSDEEEDLEDRMAGLDLNRTEEILNRLTEKERQDFERMLSDGLASSLVELWTPWWISAQQHSLVEELQESTSKESKSVIPPIFTGYEDISKIARSGVSPMIPYTAINVLFGYAYAARLFNGDHVELASESAQVVYDVSESLGRGMFTDVAASIAGCLAQLDDGKARRHFVSREYSCAVIGDVCSIISGPARDGLSNEFVLAALSECRDMFVKARKDLNGDSSGDESKQRRQQLYAAQKKLEFLSSWASSSHGVELKAELAMLEVESCRVSTEIAAFKHRHSEVQSALSVLKQRNENAQKPLITEINNE